VAARPLLRRGFTVQLDGLADRRTRDVAQESMPMVRGGFFGISGGAQHKDCADDFCFHSQAKPSGWCGNPDENYGVGIGAERECLPQRRGRSRILSAVIVTPLCSSGDVMRTGNFGWPNCGSSRWNVGRGQRNRSTIGIAVIPGWCVSTRPGISRFGVRCFASPRNDVRRSSRVLQRDPEIGFGLRLHLIERDAVDEFDQQLALARTM
jgi:hypothetical protein